jgi:hypothetical protein
MKIYRGKHFVAVTVATCWAVTGLLLASTSDDPVKKPGASEWLAQQDKEQDNKKKRRGNDGEKPPGTSGISFTRLGF